MNFVNKSYGCEEWHVDGIGMVEVEKVCVSQGKLFLIMIFIKTVLAVGVIQEIRYMSNGAYQPVKE